MNNKKRISVLIMGLVCLYLTSCNSPAEPAPVRPDVMSGIKKITLTVAGKVTNAVTGLPISGAKVELSVSYHHWDHTKLTLEAEDDGSTNKAGQYSVNCDLIKNRTHSYQLSAEAIGYIIKYHCWPNLFKDGKLWDEFEKDTTHKVDFQLEPKIGKRNPRDS